MKTTSSQDVAPIRLIHRVRQVIQNNQLLLCGERVIVAVSGGSDSLALLDVLRRIDYQLNLIAVYIDHGLRPGEVKNEIRLLQNYCHQFDITFISRSIRVKSFALTSKKSIEEAARILRYQALEKICTSQKAQAIATGHTADDQVEEFFIRLIRGGSSASLAGMDLKRDNIIRPLLHENKETLISYLDKNNIAWCTDSSNEDRKFLRNQIRLDLLPLLQNQLNPSIHRTVLQCMDILKTEDSYLKAAAATIFNNVIETQNESCLLVDGPTLLSHHLALQRRVIEQCCWTMQIKPRYQHISAILDLLANSANNSELHLEKHLRIKKQNNSLLFFQTSAGRGTTKESAPRFDTVIPGPGRYTFQEYSKVLDIVVIDQIAFEKTTIKGKLYLDEAAITYPLRLRSVRPGDRFHPFNAPGQKKVSRFFTDKKIPRNERPVHPVLADGRGIIALLGLQIDDGYKISDSTSSIVELSWDNL